ncbi:double-strand break repair helicase AddA [Sphingomonas sp. 1P06PA]|uniref:double-strand break repair helicase AddA n=1 Tax=Sphingomonas sp. 1P06PA TaxID=554121 RepID=UPI0039A411E4
MSRRVKPLQRLFGEQQQASHPADLVWLSASAGTGKTHVLTARVLRLLLAGAAPQSILCLTFTKAGAAEMAERVHERLAHWVRLADEKLRKELFNLGEPHDEEAIARARALFATVLDAPGGLRIQTIHAFCQTLLAGFPAEAGLSPGFRPIEGREEAALARSVLADLLVDAERGGDLGLIDDVQQLSRRLGEQGAERYLMDCARAAEDMAGLGPREGIEARVRTALDLPLGDIDAAIEQACGDDRFDTETLRAIGAANGRWKTAKGAARADLVARWLASDAMERATLLADLHAVWSRKDGAPLSFGKGQAPQEEGYADLAMRLHGHCAELIGLRARAGLAVLVAAGLRAGQAYALRYAAAKRAAGMVDFDDLINASVRLLNSDGIGDWIRYKLDQATDHILVDEAQDTNARQWSIIAALAGEFFAGEGARGQTTRTIFTVGDFKQAIFGFQGTDPQAFNAARQAFSMRAEQAGRGFNQLSLDRSFRSTPPVLELVDTLLDQLGPLELGVEEQLAPHLSARDGGPGTVTLWRPHSVSSAEDVEEGDETWLDDATRGFATQLARQIRRWLDEPLWLEGKGRPVRPEDILILVRKRGDLAGLLVARLHAEGVPVAGVDRLRLDRPLAVRDLLAGLRFCTQPLDDLNLSALLVSPLFGWDQDRLYRLAKQPRAGLWSTLRDRADEADTAAALGSLLAQADFVSPYMLIETILSGPLDGRRRLVARLGAEASDPIDELVNAALLFESEGTPTLQSFLDWFDRGEVDIKRDPSTPLDAVRVMTAHGAKGLQAPLVILADATGDPDRSPVSTLAWPVGEATVPLFRPRKAELAGSIAEAAERARRRDREEHLRLLYVAVTRAEERLVIGGALGPATKGVVPQSSWYAAIEAAMIALGAEEDPADEFWGHARHHRGGKPVPPLARARRLAPPEPALPAWLHAAAPQEARPPRPLAPSAIGVDAVADPPPSPAMRAAARRGTLLHALFERLPALAPVDRTAAGLRWLEQSAGVIDREEREALIADALTVIADARFADVFASDALAEAPIAAVVAGDVIAGTVDRLLVREDRVLIVDFKTGRRVPATIDAVPAHHLDQMAAYVAALASIFPDRRIEAALLYTAGPVLLPLPDDLHPRHKPGLARQEQMLSGDR